MKKYFLYDDRKTEFKSIFNDCIIFGEYSSITSDSIIVVKILKFIQADQPRGEKFVFKNNQLYHKNISGDILIPCLHINSFCLKDCLETFEFETDEEALLYLEVTMRN